MKTRILFVDDEQPVLDGFRLMLRSRRAEWTARFCSNADEAMDVLAAEEIDIVIADMRMPGKDGASLLEEVQERYPSIVRVILSGYSEMESVLRSVKPAHQFLSKPCNPEVLFETIERVKQLRNILTDSSVVHVVSRLGTLPAMPSLFLKIQIELGSADPSLNRIGALVEQDMGLSASILKVVNSSFFGIFNKVSSPAHAVNLLGVDVIKGLVLGIKFIREFDSSQYSNYSLEKLWAHSLQTAYFAKAIARQQQFDDDTVADCFSAGLLHDIGKFVLATASPEQYRAVLDRVQAGGGVVRDMEDEVLGVTHDQIGAYLLGLWGISMATVKAVYAHHIPFRAGDGITPGLVVHVANRLQHELVVSGAGYEFSSLDEDFLESQGVNPNIIEWRELCQRLLESEGEDGEA